MKDTPRSFNPKCEKQYLEHLEGSYGQIRNAHNVTANPPLFRYTIGSIVYDFVFILTQLLNQMLRIAQLALDTPDPTRSVLYDMCVNRLEKKKKLRQNLKHPPS